MKHFRNFFLVFLFFLPSAFATDIDDTSVLDAVSEKNTQTLEHDYTLSTFQSCDDMGEVLEKYMKTYWKYNKNQRYPIYNLGIADSVSEDSALEKNTSQASWIWGEAGNYYETNTQVKWVDESDIIKTDGKFIYYFNQTQKAVYIIDVQSNKVVKKIHIPKNFWGSVMYVEWNRLVILASGYIESDQLREGYFIEKSTQTLTIVYDITDKHNPELLKLYSSDGNMTESRKIGNYVYVLSNNYLNFPFWNYKQEDDIDIQVESFLPQKIDITRTDIQKDQNLILKEKTFPYNVQKWSIADCNAIEYSLPDEESLKENRFNPGYNIISILDINDTSIPVKTKVIAGNNSNVYMSLDNLYLTEWIYEPTNFSCPADAICAVPFFRWGMQNTLIHKLSVDGMNVSYQTTGLVPGSPLNQYSMDQSGESFRIITSQRAEGEVSTGLYVLDAGLKPISTLENLAPWETFQSSRFMGDKLFLVTFEQIDPLFAIDLSNESHPEILWELKIPWFSTYLHPYDQTHLIGIGYDTQENKWWGIQTAGIKIDLYKINYNKRCGDTGLTQEENKKCESWDYKGIIVEQLYTETLWGKWSYSEALNNPRMFVWDDTRHTLLLPATIEDRDDNYRSNDFFNGLFSIHIDTQTGIRLEWKTTHIDTDALEQERQQACSKYSTTQEEEPQCKELLDGTLYCWAREPKTTIPNYCFADTPVGAYIADNSWKYQENFIQRWVYIGDNVYAVSDSMMTQNEFGSLSLIDSVDMD